MQESDAQSLEAECVKLILTTPDELPSFLQEASSNIQQLWAPMLQTGPTSHIVAALRASDYFKQKAKEASQRFYSAHDSLLKATEAYIARLQPESLTSDTQVSPMIKLLNELSKKVEEIKEKSPSNPEWLWAASEQMPDLSSLLANVNGCKAAGTFLDELVAWSEAFATYCPAQVLCEVYNNAVEPKFADAEAAVMGALQTSIGESLTLEQLCNRVMAKRSNPQRSSLFGDNPCEQAVASLLSGNDLSSLDACFSVPAGEDEETWLYSTLLQKGFELRREEQRQEQTADTGVGPHAVRQPPKVEGRFAAAVVAKALEKGTAAAAKALEKGVGCSR